MAHVQVKLNCETGTLSKLRHNTNLKLLKIHSVFVSYFYFQMLVIESCIDIFVISYLQHGAQLWGQANKESQNKIQMIHNKALRKMSFKKPHDPTA